ncbi:MAG: transposase [Isosphaeraceae bacterium]
MLPAQVLDRFVERCPAAVMVRATLERLLRPERLDQIFEDSRARQYTKQLLFSQVVAVMAGVAMRTHASVHASYLAVKDRLGVSVAALYDKLNHLELGVSQALVRETAADASRVIDEMAGARKEVLPGFEVFYLDGNHLASTEHRVKELRATREGPLPGQSLALLDAQRGVIVDWVPWEDGHSQERRLLPELLGRIREGTVVVADRNFCTSKFLFGLAGGGAFFVIRQHGSTLTWKPRGRRRRAGRVASGAVYEQGVELHFQDKTLSIRRVTLRLDRPTESGEAEVHILTNLPAERVTARQAAAAYGTRWTVEGAFQTLTDVLRCEVETLGYPRAALFSFAVAVAAYNAYAVVQASLRSAHGAEAVEEGLSGHHLMSDVAATYVGMDIAVPDECWAPYRAMTAGAFGKSLTRLARGVDLARYPKKKRGPKRPQPRKKSGRRNHHISTARLLLKSRKKPP